METLLVCLLAGYGLWLAAYLWWERRQAGGGLSGEAPAPTVQPPQEAEIIGRSHFRMKAKERECQTDATSCHRRQNGTSEGKSRYICLRNRKPDIGTHP